MTRPVDHRSIGPQGFFHRVGIFIAVLLFFFLTMDGGFQTHLVPLGLMVGGITYLFFLGLGWVFRL